MRFLLTSNQMKQCDANTMEYYGMVSAVLMERAALACADEIMERFPDPDTSVLIVCGTGNNGGDGIAVGRLLYLKGYDVKLIFPGNREKASTECARQLAIAEKYNIPIETEIDEDWVFDVVVDAVFGIGLCREVGGNYKNLIISMNLLPAYKVAIDISSGVNADDGQILGVAFLADLTVTMGFGKPGQYLYPGNLYSGEVVIADIGIDENSLLDIVPTVAMLEKEDIKEMLPLRDPNGNKGSNGKLLIFAGAKNMAGAAAFAAKAAYRCGTGLVRVVTPECNRTIIQTLIPEAVLSTYDEETDMENYVAGHLAWADAVVIGPGLGTSDVAKNLVYQVLHQMKLPCVVDADALNILAQHMDWLDEIDEDAEFIFTPHLGEMSRLTGMSIEKIKEDPIESAAIFARKYEVTLVQKDAVTVIALPDDLTYLNLSGNDGMATGGSGDVLSGVVGALAAQGVYPSMAAVTGAYVHGMAGDAAAEKQGHAGMMASDLADYLQTVFE